MGDPRVDIASKHLASRILSHRNVELDEDGPTKRHLVNIIRQKKIAIQLQIELEIVLFFKLKDFKRIARIKSWYDVSIFLCYG